MKRFDPRKMWIFLVPLCVSGAFIIFLSSKVGDHFLAVHDSPAYLTPFEAFKDFGYFWNENNFGFTSYLSQAVNFFPHLFGFVSFSLGFETKTIQMALYFLSLLGIWYGSWYAFFRIITLLEGKELKFSSFFASLFYTFNLYMIAAWHGGINDGLFLLFITGPVVLWLLLDILINGITLRKSIVLGLVLGIGLNTGPFWVALVATLFVPSILFFRGRFLGACRLLAVACGIAVLEALFLVFPLAFAYLYSDPAPLRDNLSLYAFSDHGLSGIFRFFFEWTINREWGGRYFHSYYPYYDTFFIIVSAYVIWLAAVGALWFLYVKTSLRSTKTAALFLLISLLLGIFFAKASQNPLGDLNVFLYQHVPLFNIFRTPDTKFGLPVVTVVAVAVGYFFAIARSVSLRVAVAVAIFLQTAVFFTAVPIIEVKSSEEFNRIVVVPKDYYEMTAVLNGDVQDGMVLMYPGQSYGGFDYRNGYGLNGQDVLGKLIKRPVVYSDGFTFGSSERLFEDIIEGMESENIGNFGIRYMIIRRDSMGVDTGALYGKAKGNPYLEEVFASEVGSLFRVKDGFYREHIGVLTSKGDWSDIKVESKRISPVEYSLAAEGLKPGEHLVFLESFHPGWKLYTEPLWDSSGLSLWKRLSLLWKSSEFSESHRTVFGYANVWDLNIDRKTQTLPKDTYKENPDGSVNIRLTLYFQPQSYFFLGVLVSLFTCFVCVLYLFSQRNAAKRTDGYGSHKALQ